MTQFLALQIHGGADHDGGLAESLADFLAAFDGISSLTPGELFAVFLPGLAMMANIHPLLVHFPIAFLSTFFILDVIGTLANKPQWRSLASWLLYFGACSAIFTVAAGLVAAHTVAHSDAVHPFLESHQRFGLSVLGLSLILAIWRAKTGVPRKGGANNFFLILAALTCGLMVLGADLGGLMVYGYGVAVKAVPVSQDANQHHQHSH